MSTSKCPNNRVIFLKVNFWERTKMNNKSTHTHILVGHLIIGKPKERKNKILSKTVEASASMVCIDIAHSVAMVDGSDN